MAKAGLGIQLRQPYVDALVNSNIVTLEDIDRILGTRYAGVARETNEPGGQYQGPSTQPPRSEESYVRIETGSFRSAESITRHILDRYLYKEEVQDICDDLDIPVTGNKDYLVSQILGDTGFTAEMALQRVDKEGLQDLCEDLELSKSGTRDDLEGRILNAVQQAARRAPQAPAPTPYQASQVVQAPTQVVRVEERKETIREVVVLVMCPYCRTKNDQTAKKCSSCGASL